jgi:hypothetical protein
VSILDTIRTDFDNIVHHTKNAVEVAIKAAEDEAKKHEGVIVADVRAAAADALAVLKADAPEIEAALKNGAQAVLQAVEAALAAHGL